MTYTIDVNDIYKVWNDFKMPASPPILTKDRHSGR